MGAGPDAPGAAAGERTSAAEGPTRPLTAAQRRVVEHAHGPLLVQAGPGSGKTTVLVARALRLIESGVAPESLWIVTFTVAARQEVRARLGAAGARVRCGTFHAYAYGLLRAEAPGGRMPRLLDEGERLALLRRILGAYAARVRAEGGRGQEVEPGALEALSAAVSLAVNKGAARDGSAADLVAAARTAGLPGVGIPAEAFAELLGGYRAAKDAEGALDLDDMPWAALDLLGRRPGVLAAERARIAHVLVDEFQDINLPQWALVDRLAPAGDAVMAVGDADQAIYAFRGASPLWMREFPRRFPAAVRISLSENFRSRPGIVAAANRLIACGRDRVPFAGRPTRAAGAGAAVSLAGFPTPGAEARAVVAELRRRLAAGARPDELAVLYRTNTYPAGLLHALAQAGVRVAVLGGAVGVLDHWVARDILAYLHLAADGGDLAALRRIANRPNRYIGARLIAAAASGIGGTPLQRLALLPDLAPWQRARVEEFQAGLLRLAALPPSRAVDAVLRDAGYLEYLRGRAGSGAGGDLGEWVGVADELTALAGDAGDLPAFFAALEAAAAETARARAARRDAEGPGVTLTTFHAAKGLEFGTVFLVGCAEGLLPHRSALADPAGVEEERRLCYVAFTRAKDELRISYVEEGEAGGGPSRFLAEAGLLARTAAKARPAAGGRGGRHRG